MPTTRGGLGPDHVGFTAIRQDGGGRCQSGRISAADFPTTPDALPGRIPRLGVGLVSPLLLRARDGDGRRRSLQQPEFADLFLAAARTISGLFSFYDQPLVADFAGLKAAAREIRLIEHCYEPFHQRKWSSRNEQRFPLCGVVGGGVYANVPLAFLPWMLWGGRFHVGPHRIAARAAGDSCSTKRLSGNVLAANRHWSPTRKQGMCLKHRGKRIPSLRGGLQCPK